MTGPTLGQKTIAMTDVIAAGWSWWWPSNHAQSYPSIAAASAAPCKPRLRAKHSNPNSAAASSTLEQCSTAESDDGTDSGCITIPSSSSRASSSRNVSFTIIDLPPELIAAILCWLRWTPGDLARAESSCRVLYNTVSQFSIWRVAARTLGIIDPTVAAMHSVHQLSLRRLKRAVLLDQGWLSDYTIPALSSPRSTEIVRRLPPVPRGCSRTILAVCAGEIQKDWDNHEDPPSLMIQPQLPADISCTYRPCNKYRSSSDTLVWIRCLTDAKRMCGAVSLETGRVEWAFHVTDHEERCRCVVGLRGPSDWGVDRCDRGAHLHVRRRNMSLAPKRTVDKARDVQELDSSLGTLECVVELPSSDEDEVTFTVWLEHDVHADTYLRGDNLFIVSELDDDDVTNSAIPPVKSENFLLQMFELSSTQISGKHYHVKWERRVKIRTGSTGDARPLHVIDVAMNDRVIALAALFENPSMTDTPEILSATIASNSTQSRPTVLILDLDTGATISQYALPRGPRGIVSDMRLTSTCLVLRRDPLPPSFLGLPGSISQSSRPATPFGSVGKGSTLTFHSLQTGATLRTVSVPVSKDDILPSFRGRGWFYAEVQSELEVTHDSSAFILLGAANLSILHTPRNGFAKLDRWARPWVADLKDPRRWFVHGFWVVYRDDEDRDGGAVGEIKVVWFEIPLKKSDCVVWCSCPGCLSSESLTGCEDYDGGYDPDELWTPRSVIKMRGGVDRARDEDEMTTVSVWTDV